MQLWQKQSRVQLIWVNCTAASRTGDPPRCAAAGESEQDERSGGYYRNPSASETGYIGSLELTTAFIFAALFVAGAC